ncbi:hypothetical protein EYF80_027373 [Liparis tanakae]|uniref:Uncharacterized protein n=1 Tax=Liparis tanakae TaxID=230148 RepID=A0A4Z2HC62_9TELE|nr:hypothetical protein EYF80_027373 [Liparis tanakae]
MLGGERDTMHEVLQRVAAPATRQENVSYRLGFISLSSFTAVHKLVDNQSTVSRSLSSHSFFQLAGDEAASDEKSRYLSERRGSCQKWCHGVPYTGDCNKRIQHMAMQQAALPVSLSMVLDSGLFGRSIRTMDREPPFSRSWPQNTQHQT